MEELWIFEGNRKRRAENHICVCGLPFLVRIGSKAKFCSKNCAAKSRISQTQKQCANCGETIFRAISKLNNSKSGFYFCNRQCKEKAQSIDGNCLEIRPSHYGATLQNYRKIMKDALSKGCSACGIKQSFKLTIHHIDGDRQNNLPSNLEVVCWNCHSVRHLRLTNGEWVYDPKSLTPLQDVKEFDELIRWVIGT
jgi:hypothetical protein